MTTTNFRRIFYFLRIGVPLLALIHLAAAGDTKLTRQEGGTIKVTCPDLKQGDVFATSFIKKSSNGRFVTLFTRRDKAAFTRPSTPSDEVTLDESSLTMTVANLKIQDNGATYSCKVFSSMREVSNNVMVTVKVPPKINFTVTPAGPYQDRTIVTVTCVVDRVSPALPGAGMSLRIAGNEHQDVTMTRNQDSTYRYTISRRHLVTKSSDGTETVCKVKAADRKQYRKSKRILLVRAPSGKPSMSVSKTVTRPGDLLKLTCNLKKKGVPAANKYTWFKNSRVFKNTPTSTHTFKVPSQEAAGSFSCKATNAEGSSNVSMPKCVAFTKEPYVGTSFPLWISIVSILLNIAAAVFIVMVHIKPRVLQFMEKRQLKSLKRLNEGSDNSNPSDTKEEGKSEKDAEKNNLESLEKPTDHAYSFDVQSGVPNNLAHVYDQPEQLTDSTGKDKEELGPEHLPMEQQQEQQPAANEDIRL